MRSSKRQASWQAGGQAGGRLKRLCPLRSVGLPVVRVPDHAAAASCLAGAASLVRPRAVFRGPFCRPCEAPASPDPTQQWRCRSDGARAQGLAHGLPPQALSAVLARSVLVLKKLGDELLADFVRVLQFLGVEEGMRVLVEPHEYLKLVGRAGLGFIDTYTPAEACKCGHPEPARSVFHHTRLPVWVAARPGTWQPPACGTS